MEGLRKSRASCRGWLKREADSLSAMLKSKPAVDIHTLTFQVQEFERRLSSLDEAQCKLEAAIDDDEALEKEIDEAYIYRAEHFLAVKCEAMAAIERFKAATKGRGASSSSCVAKANLPKLEIPVFKGDIQNWQSFWDQYEAIVDKSDLPTISKYSYLRSLVGGDALDVIRGLSLVESNYDVACNCLKDRYAKPERTIFTHIQSLLSMSVPTATSLSVSQLWKIRDEVNIHVRCLENLGVSGDKFGLFLTPMILSKLPHEFRMEWARNGAGKESDLIYLLTFMKTEIERRERSEGFKSVKNVGKADDKKLSSNTVTQPPVMGTASCMLTSAEISNESCVFCGKSHLSVKCWKLPKLSFQTRHEIIKSAGACFKCLAKNHRARGCMEKCRRCKGGHHEVLCNPERTGTGTGNGGSASGGRNDKFQVNKNSDDNGPRNRNQHFVQGCTSGPTDPVNVSKPTLSHVKVSCSSVGETRKVLQTARVMVQGTTGLVPATVVFDTAADDSYITSSLVKKIAPKWVTTRLLAYSVFGSKRSSASSVHNVFDLSLQDKNGGQVKLNAVEVEVISTPLYRPSVPEKILNSLSDLDMADQYDTGREISIDILIGMDQYWRFMDLQNQTVKLSDSFAALCTVFGWVLSGSFQNKSQGETGECPGSCLMTISDVHEDTLKRFWDLDTIGISPENPQNKVDDKVLETFNESVRFKEGRYEVHLPWKEDPSPLNLLNNRKLAEARLHRLNFKLKKEPKLLGQYDEALSEMESLGFISEVLPGEMAVDGPVFYLPHRPIVKESSLTTRVRPVFDASAKGVNHISLNDCMEAGPSLLPKIVDVLMRFRRWQVGLTTDITKAFLQIGVCKEDQDVHRFLWLQNDSIRVMKFLRVPFGNTSSPFLLNATIRHHLSRYPTSKVIADLEDNLYVDDWITGEDTDVEVCSLYEEGKTVLGEGGFPLAKCATNSDAVNEVFFREFGAKHSETVATKILGLKWSKRDDCFCFDGIEVPKELVTTKRVVLSFMARLYDPLGFLNPFVMVIKIIVQDIWALKLDWDVAVPQSIHSRFLKWVDGLSLIHDWKIPRRYCTSPWSSLDPTEIEIHCFGDASPRGYGACAYIRVPRGDGTFEVSLITSRSRVAPMKEISLPRLELLGALLCARLLKSVKVALKVPNVPGYCWTDSMVVLGWVKGRPCRWKTFVANRVKEIQNLVDPAMFSHCPGKGNPADYLTRGLYAEQLIDSSQWLQGPEWLSKPISPPTEQVSFDQVEQFLQLECVPTATVMVATVFVPVEKVLEVERWSTLGKAMRIAAYVLRFIDNTRYHKRTTGELTLEELEKAKKVLIGHTQQVVYGAEIEDLKQGRRVAKSSPLVNLSPLIGRDDLVRIGGRLDNANLSYAEKHPVILPKCHLSLLLIRAEHVRLEHAGVETVVTNIRDTYWIIGCRRLAKSVKKCCFTCQLRDALACNQVAAPLPELRVHEAPVFTVTGMDNGGPLFCLDFPGKKFYILLFTCAVVRAVHLELVDSLEIPDCVLALKRFFARRGVPSILYSDNASTFKGTETLMIKVYGTIFPKWKNILPKSPWWGGWWERLIQTVKRSLKKTVGNKWLTKIELETTLCEIEACVNCRPLTFVGDNIDCSKPLTPSHFLLGRNVGFQTKVEECEFEVNQEHLSESELIRQRRLELFWSVWSKDYLRNLPPAVNKFQTRGNVGVGSVVLIREDNFNRMRWPLGVVTKLLPGKDGIVRAVELKTAKGFLNRPVQRLHDLEVSTCVSSLPGVDGGSDSSAVERSDVPRQGKVTVTRSGRVSKPRKKLNL